MGHRGMVSTHRGMGHVPVLAILLLAALLSACATTSAPARDKIVAERAQARWDALLAGDYEAAWAYASPGYRSANTAVDFEIAFRLRRVEYRSAEYQEHSCEEDVCTVKLRVGYRLDRPLVGVPEWESEGVVEEQWIKSGGEWWYRAE